MSNSIMFNGLEFKRTCKKQYEVYVCRPRLGSSVRNKLEGSQYITEQNRQFVISGTVGETWVIDVNKLIKTYDFINGDPITTEALRKRMNSNGIIDWMHLKTKSMRQEINFAAHLPIRKARNFPVQTSWGDILYANRDGVSHGNGDFLVCASINGQPNFSDIWVVNGKIFPNTYNIKNFTNIISNSTIKSETPRPKSILA